MNVSSFNNENKDFYRFFLLRGEHIIVLKSLDDVGSSNFAYSIPLRYGNQYPILLKVYSGDFLSYKIIRDKAEYNTIIKFKLPPMKKDEEIKINFEYWVLIKKFYKENLPKFTFPVSENNLPEFVKKWLIPTKSVQSNNFLIKITANILKGCEKDVFVFIKKVMIWNAFRRSIFTSIKRFIISNSFFNKFFIPDRYWTNLEDAVSCLLFGSFCTGQANLAAAILRSKGIPVRILISSNDFYGKNHWLDAQHVLNEFYCPDFGWIQTQSGKLFLTQGNNIILRIVSPEEENIAGNGVGGCGGKNPWFWMDNEKIVFGKPKNFMEYKMPKSKKIGVPSARVWKECKFDIPVDISDEVMKITSEVWNLFIKIVGRYNDEKDRQFYKGLSLHNQSIEYLLKSNFKEYIQTMKQTKDSYKKLL